jgi:hypothetical protein
MEARADNILPNSSAETGALPDADFWVQEFGMADVIEDPALARTGNRVWRLDAADPANNISSVGQLPVVAAGEKFTVSAWVRIPNASPTRQVNVRQRWGFLSGGGFNGVNGSAQYYIKDSNWHLITGPEITCTADGDRLVARIYVMNQYRESDEGPDLIDTGGNNFPAYVDDLTAESPDYTFSTVSGAITDGGSGVAGALIRATQTANPAFFSVSAPSDASGNYSVTCRVGREYALTASSLPIGRAVVTSPAAFTPADASPLTGKDFTLGAGPLVYDFDNVTLQGWTDIGGGTNQVVSRTGGDTGSGQSGSYYASVDDWNSRDTTASTLWLRSPGFILDAPAELSDLTFWMAGGTGSGVGALPAKDAQVAIGQGATASGFLGLALRDATTGDFVLKASRAGAGGDWQQFSFSAQDLAANTVEGREYTLDFIDTHSGGWGWICLDSVSIPAVLAPPPVYTTISGTVVDGGAGVVVRAGTLTGTTLADGTYTIANAVVGHSYTLTLSALPTGQIVDTTPATFTAVASSNPNKDFSLKADPDNDPDLFFAARSSTYTGVGNWSTAYPVGAVLNRQNTPETATINGQNWIVNQRGAGGDDGFELGGIDGLAGGVDCDGASIVVAVRPVYPLGLGGEPRGEIVSLYYNGLVLATDRDTGEVMIARKAWDWRRTGYVIPNGQITVLSLVVQRDGACRLHANGTEVWTSQAIGTDSFARLQGTDTNWMTRVGVGRNPWDGWSSFNGNIGDVLVYKVALDDTKRTALETAMITKFGSSTNYTITATAGTGGTIAPIDAVTVPQNSDKTFTVTPEKYFDVTSVLVNGTTEVLTGPNAATYTLANVTADGSIAASFTEWALTEITGKVALGDGTGVAGILVTVSGGREPYTALTSETGTYSIRVKPGVTYTVSASKTGWGITPASLTAGPGDLTDKNLVAQFVGTQRLVHVVASPDLTNDAPLTSWPNLGTLGGTFIADGGFDTAAPITRSSIGGSKAVEFNNNKMLLSSTTSTADRIMAPASITGPGSNFTVFAKLYAAGAGQNDPWEQFFLAWSRRNGPEGTCASFGYGKGWWGAIGGWGYGDTNYGVLYPGTDRTVAPAWGQWNAVAMTSDGTTVTIYYNGEVVNTVTKTLNWHSGMPISLGAQYWGNDGMGRDIPFNGGIMELSIYDAPLSASEIAALSTFFDPNDTDADGMPDAWEIAAVGNLNDLTLNGDFDGDGTSDAAEYRLGLIPNDPKSRFAATIVRAPVTGFVTLTWPSRIGARFDVMWSDNLTDWSVLGTVEDTTEEGSTETFTDDLEDILDYPKAFYKVLLKP